jgi:hypothetical protein
MMVENTVPANISTEDKDGNRGMKKFHNERLVSCTVQMKSKRVKLKRHVIGKSERNIPSWT